MCSGMDNTTLLVLSSLIRISTGRRIFAPHRGFSQLVTSFFGAMYQGIHLNALCSLNFSSSLAYLAIFWVSFYFHKNSLTLTRLIAFYSSEVFPLFLKLLPFVLTISTFKIAFFVLVSSLYAVVNLRSTDESGVRFLLVFKEKPSCRSRQLLYNIKVQKICQVLF